MADRARGYWTIGGDFILADPDDEDAPLVTVTFHYRLIREAMTDKSARGTFIASLAKLMREVPHPFDNDTPAGEEE